MVLDASFSKASWRDKAAALAAETDADLTEVRCLLPQEVAAARLAQRAADRWDRCLRRHPAVAAEMATEFEEWPSAASVGALPPVEDVLPGVLDLLGAPHPRHTAPVAPPP